MFYKQFELFANWQGRLWGFVNLVLSDKEKTSDIDKYKVRSGASVSEDFALFNWTSMDKRFIVLIAGPELWLPCHLVAIDL